MREIYRDAAATLSFFWILISSVTLNVRSIVALLFEKVIDIHFVFLCPSLNSFALMLHVVIAA